MKNFRPFAALTMAAAVVLLPTYARTAAPLPGGLLVDLPGRLSSVDAGDAWRLARRLDPAQLLPKAAANADDGQTHPFPHPFQIDPAVINFMP